MLLLPPIRSRFGFPTLTVGRVGEHKVELHIGEGVAGERGVVGSTDDVVGRFAFALEEHIGLTYRVGLGVDLLAVEVGGYLFFVFIRQFVEVSSATVNIPPVPQAPS